MAGAAQGRGRMAADILSSLLYLSWSLGATLRCASDSLKGSDLGCATCLSGQAWRTAGNSRLLGYCVWISNGCNISHSTPNSATQSLVGRRLIHLDQSKQVFIACSARRMPALAPSLPYSFAPSFSSVPRKVVMDVRAPSISSSSAGKRGCTLESLLFNNANLCAQ